MVSLAVEVAVVEAALMAEGLSTAGPHKDREGYCAGSRADTVPRSLQLVPSFALEYPSEGPSPGVASALGWPSTLRRSDTIITSG
eukprot:7013758-Pyramimonas_sp.AAC.1